MRNQVMEFEAALEQTSISTGPLEEPHTAWTGHRKLLAGKTRVPSRQGPRETMQISAFRGHQG
jgi:hypothetical protein